MALLGVAAGDVALLRQQVALAVDERRIGRGRLLWVVHGGQNLIFDLDELLGLFQNLRRLSRDKGQMRRRGSGRRRRRGP